LAVLARRGQLNVPLRPMSRESLEATLAPDRSAALARVLIIGASGRCGRGARTALAVAGITPTCWGLKDTWRLDRAALLAHDVLLTAVLTPTPVPPFPTPADLDAPARQLAVISDVTCDVTSDYNTLPIYDSTTSWRAPLRRLRDGARPLDIIAIDNLP